MHRGERAGRRGEDRERARGGPEASALLGLMPLVAQRSGGGAAMYTAMMACLGAGAIVGLVVGYIHYSLWITQWGP